MLQLKVLMEKIKIIQYFNEKYALIINSLKTETIIMIQNHNLTSIF